MNRPSSSRSRSESPLITDKHQLLDARPRHTRDSMDSLEDSEPLHASPSLRTPPPPYLEKLASTGSRRAPNWLKRPRPRSVLAFILAALSLFFVLSFFLNTHQSSMTSFGWASGKSDPSGRQRLSAYPQGVKGAPTRSFRDNMRNDTNYLTCWINAGWTNDVMTYINLIYLASLTGRTAVIPPFAPSHVGRKAGFVPVSHVFDLGRLQDETSIPVIEWADLKELEPPSGFEGEGEQLGDGDNPNSTWAPQEETLGCWSIWATSSPTRSDAQEEKDARVPRHNEIESQLGLDVSYTRVPPNTILLPQYPNDPHVKFWELAALTFPEGRADAHIPLPESEGGRGAHYAAAKSGGRELPDEQLTCFDFMYYVSEQRTFEMWYEWSPAWRFVGTHMHWNTTLTSIASSMIRQTFGLNPDSGDEDELPPFVSLHIRHGDFKQYCQGQDGEGGSCFASLEELAMQVESVREETFGRTGIRATKVLVTSDETDSGWWEGVRELGWEWVDHTALRTVEKYGIWYPVFIDAVIQSMGAAFVGTEQSTMSLLAKRRVEDWQAGKAVMAKWH